MTSRFALSVRQHGTSLGRVLIAVSLVCGIAGAPVLGTASARADDIGVSGQPANATGKLDGRTRYSYAADPGQQISDTYLVTNTGTTRQTYTILATDAYNNDKGDFALLETAQEPIDAGTWVAFDDGSHKQRFDLDPGQQRVMHFTIAVPANATPGDHAGGLVSSVVTPGAQVALDRRVATRLYVRVSGHLQPALTITGVKASHTGSWWNPFTGSLHLRYTITNTGNIALASNVSTKATTWFGVPVGQASGGSVKELLPGATRVAEADIPGVGQVGYANAQVRLNPFVEGPDTNKQMPIVPVVRNAFVWALPWSLLIAAGLVGLAFVYRAWRRRRDAKAAQEWMDYTAQEAERKASEHAASQAGGSGGTDAGDGLGEGPVAR